MEEWDWNVKHVCKIPLKRHLDQNRKYLKDFITVFAVYRFFIRPGLSRAQRS